MLLPYILTIFFPPLGLPIGLWGIKKDSKNWGIYIFCLAWCLGIFAYCYVPTTGTDLTRYNSFLESIKGNSFYENFNNNVYAENYLYSFVFVCWFVNFVNNINLLPAISVFSVYYIGFYITCKIGEKLNTTSEIVFSYIVCIIFYVSFYSVVNNVRNVWAFSLISLAIFRDLYEEKHGLFTIFLYIFPVFLHVSAIILILIRLNIKFIKKNRFFLVIAIFIVPEVLNLLSDKINTVSENIIVGLVQRMILKGNNYFEHINSPWALVIKSSGSAKMAKVLYMTIAICLILDRFMIQHEFKILSKNGLCGLNNKQNDFLDYSFSLALLTVACMPMVMPEYWRFAAVLILCGSIFVVLSKTIFSYTRNKFFYYIIILFKIFAVFCFFLAMRNLIIYSDVLSMVVKSFFCNPITILLDSCY